ncbi:MAG: glycosyltransferase [Odoribacter splanchnicus]|nr:glycosyltransferase [Odoribacter splanchnicus]
MHIAIVTPQMIVGGAETYIIIKSRWLIAHGHQVTVVSAGGCNVSNLPSQVEHVEFITEISPGAFSCNEYEDYLKKLANILIARKIEVIEAHNTSPAIHVAQAYKYHKIPFLINILNERTYLYNPFLKILTKRLAMTGVLYTLTKQMVVFIESQLKRKIKANIIPIPVEGIPLMEQMEGKEQKEMYILSVCRMEADKMYVKYLIQEFGVLLQTRRLPITCKLHLVGEGKLLDTVKKLVQRVNENVGAEVITMLGTLVGEKLWQEYRGASLYVGTGTSLLLAASCGKPALIPGYTIKSMPYAWGVWGERESDVEVLATTEKQNNPRSKYCDIIEELLVKCPSRAIEAGRNAHRIYNAYYSIEPIMERWQKEYGNIVMIFSKKAVEIEKAIDIAFHVKLYRIVWKCYNIIRKR